MLPIAHMYHDDNSQTALLFRQNQELWQQNSYFSDCLRHQQQVIETLQSQNKTVNRANGTNSNLELRDITNAHREQKKQSPLTKKVKRYYDCSESQRTRRNREMERIFNVATKELNDDITKVKIEMEFDNGKKKEFYSRAPEVTQTNAMLQYQENLNDKKIAQQVLIVKDRYRISDDALHELHMIGSVLPSKNVIREERKRMNTVMPVHVYPRAENDCSTRKINDLLEYVLQHEKYNSYIQKENDKLTLTLRFACDGAQVTKKLNSVRGVVKLIAARNSLPEDMSELSMSPDDEHTLFFYLGDENRYALKKYGGATFKDMKTISENGIDINGKKINVEWILTCDWKALCLLKGINAANSDFFCLWCHCTKSQICDFSIPAWPIQRYAHEQTQLTETYSQGYINEDICSFISYSSMAPDDLHLRIRLSLKLLNQVVTWAIDQKCESKLEAEMKRIGGSFQMWEERGDDKSNSSVKKWSQPSGDNLKIIIKKNLKLYNILDNKADRYLVNVCSLSMNQLKEEVGKRDLSKKGKKIYLVQRLEEASGGTKKKCPKGSSASFDDDDEDDDSLDVDHVQILWDEFDVMMEALRAMPGSETYQTPAELMRNARQWAQNFRKYTFAEDVTPYLHAFVYHVPFFLEKYRYLHDIGVAQVERKNYDQRLAYFDCTNRNGGRNKKKVSEQIMERENRLLWSSCEGKTRKIRKYCKKE